MKVGFSGTQQGMTPEQMETLRWAFSVLTYPIEFHHGDCIGADEEAHLIVRGFPSKVVGHPPVKENKRAFCEFDEEREPKEYLKRNWDIAEETDILFITPKEDKERKIGSGTWATYRYARKQGKPVLIILPDGRLMWAENLTS